MISSRPAPGNEIHHTLHRAQSLLPDRWIDMNLVAPGFQSGRVGKTSFCFAQHWGIEIGGQRKDVAHPTGLEVSVDVERLEEPAGA